MSLLAANYDLLLAFRVGERAALDLVYRHYRADLQAAVTRHLWRLSGAPAGWRNVQVVEPDDVVQETFARAFAPERRRSYDGRRPFAPFLRAIALHALVDCHRASGREIAAESAAIERVLEREPPLEPAPGHHHTLAAVHHLVERLPHELRAVHETRYVVGLSQRRAACALGVGRQVLRTLESRLHLEVRQALDALGAAA